MNAASNIRYSLSLMGFGVLFGLLLVAWTGPNSSVEEWTGMNFENAEIATGLQHSFTNTLDVASVDTVVVIDSTRTLSEFYARRAFPGAPPYIPHDVTDANDYGGRACLRCHNRSRYVPRIGAYTPITPHPELLSCRSCHTLPVTDGQFRETAWEKPPAPELNGAALPTSPPPIPHALQLRENCLVCHSGPGSVLELRTSHPERVQCRQCHASVAVEKEWIR